MKILPLMIFCRKLKYHINMFIMHICGIIYNLFYLIFINWINCNRYREIRTSSNKKKNALFPLNIKTYDGHNKALHPKVLYFENGWNGGKYWMVLTPYHDMDESIENPCIYISQDGFDFRACQNAYPLDSISLTANEEYNSDPHLVYNNDLDRIECWWRRVLTNNYPKQNQQNTEILYRSFCYDGLHWSKKEEIYRIKNSSECNGKTASLISPAILYEKNKYYIWASKLNFDKRNNRTVVTYEFTNDGKITLINEIELYNCQPSHLDIIKNNGLFYLIVFDAQIKSFPYKLYTFNNVIESHYHYRGLVLKKGFLGSWDGNRLYRPSLCFCNDHWRLYYSAYNSYNPKSCNIGLILFKDWKYLRLQQEM